MNRLEELIKNPTKFNLSNEAIDSLRELFVTFETNPFFPMSGYDYARRFLMQLYFAGFISSDLVQCILSEFKKSG
ncbi:hypothetical protein IHC33_000929 [Enterococcus faecalis]|uniref:hypothetical protein n=1 Tax=Enterococcus faecalis TaxID=1351 RepID=UPI00100FDA32|nr:hypothetical protein [Enterococcus faecalis]EGO2608950.1 hypothetical protein [Enterococcus faecalis]EGO8831038.1 hypothetical protein [Enterococcus faecalis]EGO9254373.1 hypothetical protein [Enterococcus faecalis]EGS8307645.1 hypothetical protein [Enterococcus faecalis]EHB5052880.1 hypothetical protein [Enterococcus faecalis]